LSCSDALSGCFKTFYCLDNDDLCTPNIEYTGPVSYIGSGFVRYNSVDIANNPEPVRSETLCIDIDGDGYGANGSPGCPQPGEVDCNDNNQAVNPGATEVCNNIDDNCNALIDEVDDDNDGVNDCSDDICLETPDEEVVIQTGILAGCTARQGKEEAIAEYTALDLPNQPNSEIGSGEYEDVLDQYLIPAVDTIIFHNYLFRYDTKFEENGSEVTIAKGTENFDLQNNAVEKLEEFKGKKINGEEIRKIPSIKNELDKIETKLVEDSRLLAKVLLDELDCDSLSGDAKKECNEGWKYFNEASSKSKNAEKIDFYKKAWEQGVKTLEKLDVEGNVASLLYPTVNLFCQWFGWFC